MSGSTWKCSDKLAWSPITHSIRGNTDGSYHKLPSQIHFMKGSNILNGLYALCIYLIGINVYEFTHSLNYVKKAIVFCLCFSSLKYVILNTSMTNYRKFRHHRAVLVITILWAVQCSVSLRSAYVCFDRNFSAELCLPLGTAEIRGDVTLYDAARFHVIQFGFYRALTLYLTGIISFHGGKQSAYSGPVSG